MLVSSTPDTVEYLSVLFVNTQGLILARKRGIKMESFRSAGRAFLGQPFTSLRFRVWLDTINITRSSLCL